MSFNFNSFTFSLARIKISLIIFPTHWPMFVLFTMTTMFLITMSKMFQFYTMTFHFTDIIKASIILPTHRLFKIRAITFGTLLILIFTHTHTIHLTLTVKIFPIYSTKTFIALKIAFTSLFRLT